MSSCDSGMPRIFAHLRLQQSHDVLQLHIWVDLNYEGLSEVGQKCQLHSVVVVSVCFSDVDRDERVSVVVVRIKMRKCFEWIGKAL